MSSLDAAIFGIIGGFLPELLGLYKLRRKRPSDWPAYLGWWSYWVVTFAFNIGAAGVPTFAPAVRPSPRDPRVRVPTSIPSCTADHSRPGDDSQRAFHRGTPGRYQTGSEGRGLPRANTSYEELLAATRHHSRRRICLAVPVGRSCRFSRPEPHGSDRQDLRRQPTSICLGHRGRSTRLRLCSRGGC